jgi:hypothetical protein
MALQVTRHGLGTVVERDRDDRFGAQALDHTVAAAFHEISDLPQPLSQQTVSEAFVDR